LISVEEELKNFIIDRLRIILKTEEIKPDIIDSVLSLDNINNVPFLIIYKRIHLLNKIISLDEFNMFLVNFKRLNNILKSEGLSKYNSLNVNVDLLKTSFETNLCEMINDINDLSTKLQNELNIQQIVLDKFVEAYPSINLFFENTIINDKNEIIRENRLCLLFKLKQAIVNYANFDLIDN
jgi:glycyl-tRNA synthetase beta chain